MRTQIVAAALTAALSLAPLPAFALDPVYEGGYPTAATAEAAFEEYDYQASDPAGRNPVLMHPTESLWQTITSRP